jgi:hypothetical protein
MSPFTALTYLNQESAMRKVEFCEQEALVSWPGFFDIE